LFPGKKNEKEKGSSETAAEWRHVCGGEGNAKEFVDALLQSFAREGEKGEARALLSPGAEGVADRKRKGKSSRTGKGGERETTRTVQPFLQREKSEGERKKKLH